MIGTINLNGIPVQYDLQRKKVKNINLRIKSDQSIFVSANDSIPLNSELSLDHISSHFFISRYYLNRKFKRVTGSTVWAYITIKRLIWARQQIRSGIPAMEVCRMSGFHDYSSFFRAYKDYFTVSPLTDRPRQIKPRCGVDLPLLPSKHAPIETCVGYTVAKI